MPLAIVDSDGLNCSDALLNTSFGTSLAKFDTLPGPGVFKERLAYFCKVM